MTAHLADFLADRLAQDQQRVERVLAFLKSVPRVEPASSPGEAEISWSADSAGSEVVLRLRPGGVDVCFREDPRRLEHDVRARTLAAADHLSTPDGTCTTCAVVSEGHLRRIPYPCPTLRRLTWVYAEHPEFDASWFDS